MSNPDRNSLIYVYEGDGPADGDTVVFDAATGRWKAGQSGTSVLSVVAGAGVTVDATDPANPVVSATAVAPNNYVFGTGVVNIPLPQGTPTTVAGLVDHSSGGSDVTVNVDTETLQFAAGRYLIRLQILFAGSGGTTWGGVAPHTFSNISNSNSIQQISFFAAPNGAAVEVVFLVRATAGAAISWDVFAAGGSGDDALYECDIDVVRLS